MYILAFDTTASACSIILQKDKEVLSEYKQIMDFGQSEVLIPQIQKMLTDANLQFKDINLLFVCVGPGSFTGVRSSISAARTFQLACPELLLSGVSAFDAYILTLAPQEIADINAVIIETKRDDFYVQLFDSSLKKISPPQAATYDTILNMLKGKKVSLIGDGVERFLRQPSGLSLHCIKMEDCPSINGIISAGLRQFKEKCLDYPKPLYLRVPDVSQPKS